MRTQRRCTRNISTQYRKILKDIAEDYNRTLSPQIKDAKLVYSLTVILMETAESSKVLRSGEIQSGNTDDNRAYESDGAHVNLVQMLVSLYIETMLCKKIPIRYILKHPKLLARRLYYRLSWPHWSIIEAMIKMHDLAENESGDIADNGRRNELAKRSMEQSYLNDLRKYYDEIFGKRKAKRIFQLYKEFEEKSTPLGQVIYCADKIAAPLYFINSDASGTRSYVSKNEVEKSELNKKSAELCEETNQGYLLGKLWTADFVYTRRIVQYDTEMFFTAIAIMMTLVVYGKWFDTESERVKR